MHVCDLRILELNRIIFWGIFFYPTAEYCIIVIVRRRLKSFIYQARCIGRGASSPKRWSPLFLSKHFS